jgi:two-component system, LuxR family, response regulator FixJ
MPPEQSMVYVVDDDSAVRQTIVIVLRAEGYAAAGFENASDFLDAAPALTRGCIVSDVRMPGMTGIELQQALAARGNQMPLILVTAYADVKLAVGAMRAGAVDFIEKPFDPADLLAAVARAFERQQGSSALPAPDLAASRVAALTQRENQVLERLVEGLPNKLIGADLGISTRTVESHRARVMEKIGARCLSDAIRIGIAAGMGAGGARSSQRPG